MPTISDVVEILQRFAPVALAEDWDNVGLLVGDYSWRADRVMTCLTVTPDTLAEAVDKGANLIVTHHPLPFRPIQSVTSDTTAGRMLLELVSARIGVYSPHTAFDSAQAGINQHLAIGLDLQQIEPLIPAEASEDQEVGTGRIGVVPEELNLAEMAERVKTFLDIGALRIVGDEKQAITRVAIACGSGGSFLADVAQRQCDCLITGEATFHICLDAQAQGIALVLPGHFASEHFALHSLADYLGEQFSDVQVWASREERDPLQPF